MKIKRAITYILVVIMLVNSMNVYAAETKEYINEESIIHNEEDWDNDQAFAAYVEKTFYGNNAISLYGVSAREQLGASEKLLYDFLKEKVESVADGTCTSTKFSAESDKLEEWKNAGAKLSWNAEKLGVGTIWNSTHTGISEEAKTAFNNKALGQFGLSKVIDALLHDCPYDLYWFDKTKGVNSNYGITVSGEELSLNSYFASFSVASAYKAAGANEYTTDIAKTSATVTAANNAKAIVEKYAEASDLEKLKAYRDEICALVSYNYDAISSSYTGGYGDPWQLVYVFDKDNNTNVVCEGYSKAFQYLCDMSTFTSDKICCYTVHGTMAGGTGAGKHMWNIVSMDDGKNYLVDITNSDAGSIGQNGELFLSGATGSVGEGYVINVSGDNISFTYEDDCNEMWGTDGILLLAGAKYGVSEEGGKPEASEAPIASEAPKSDEYNVLIWTTAIRESFQHPYIDCIENIYNQLSEDDRKIVCTRQTSGTTTNPTHFTGTEVLEDIYDIIFIFMPSVGLNNNDIKVLKKYVKAGGRIVLQGENPIAAPVENPILSSLAKELGTTFTITDTMVSGEVVADINLKSDLLAGKNYGNIKLVFAAYSEIEYAEPAEVIASYDGKAGIVDQAVEKGRITVVSDFNYFDNTRRTDFVSKLFLQLLLNSSENKNIVEEGGDPNIGFGEPCALKGSVNIAGHSWTDFSDAEVSDRFYAQAQTVAVNVQDKKCGIGKVYTHISGEVVSGTAINALTDADWKELEANEGTGTFEFTSEQEGIIYAKITDAEGNIKYISTDRIIVDTIAPVIHGIENDKTYCQPVSFTVEDAHLDSVTLDGVAITADEQGKYSFEITQDEHVVVATDKAGNTTTVTLVNGHTWVYTASANVITAKCSNTGCSYGTEGVTLTIEAETPVEYTTEPYNKLNVVNDITSVTGEIAGSTLYYKANEENRPEGEALASVPSDIGKYVAAITLGGQTAYSMFEIKDTTAPVIKGINEEVYCQPVSYTVEDIDLLSVTLDGEEVLPDENGKYNMEYTPGKHEIIAKDRTGNTTSVTLTMEHVWVYTASANVITAKCSNTGCSYGTEGVTLTIETETPVEYTSEPYDKLNIVNNITPVTGEIAGSTLYYKANEDNEPEGEALASVPSDIGKYVAAITLGGQTAYSVFEIKDTTAPVIKGINEEVYCQPLSYTVEDIDLMSVTLDGEEVSPDENGKYNMEYTPGKHEIIAKDRTGNTTSVTLTMEHVWVYTSSANVITAKCSNSGCAYETKGVTLTIKAETPSEYTSEPYDKLNIVNNITPVTGEIAGSTLYYKANKENEPEGEALVSVPSDIGKYVAAITLGGQTAYSVFEIKDTIPPIIHGIEEDKTYLDNVSFTVEELDLAEVTVDGIKVEADKDGKYAITITKEEHTVEAKDKSGNTTKTIVRNGKPLQCTINWDEDGDGKADSSELLDYGVIPKHNPVEMQDDFQYKYQFMGWSPDIEAVTTDKMYSAVFTKTLQEYTVSFPETRLGYDLIPQIGSKSPVTYNGSYSFYVDAKPGYDNSALVVTANGKIVIPENGLYKLTGIGCDGRDVQVNISIADTVGPIGSIQVGKDIWSVLQKNISYDKFYTTKQTVEIKGVDYGVGIQSISYCITDKEILESEFDSLSWIPYKSKFSINPNVRGIIYAKIVDNMGNETYISTCGLIFEAPDGKNDIWKNEEVAKFEKYVYKQTSDDDLKGSFYNKVRARGVKQKKKRVTLQWNTVMDADGYIIYGNQCNHGGKIYKIKKLATLKNSDITKWTNKKLKKGTYYKYTVTAYKLIDGKQKVLSVSKMVHVVTDGGKYSNPDSVKVNKKTITIKVGKSKKIKATRKLAKGKIMREHTDKFRYESTNKKVATVNKKGKIVGKSKGTCSVYVYIQNGKCATVKVKVN